MLVQVLRPFNAEGRVLTPGAVVDASRWVHTHKLVEQRYVLPLVEVSREEPRPRRNEK